jgi:antitoxin HicB
MTERLQYSMVVNWSEEDQAYLVTLPEWDDLVFNPVTHGETYEQAVAHGHEALAALVASARQRGLQLPEPQVFSAAAR